MIIIQRAKLKITRCRNVISIENHAASSFIDRYSINKSHNNFSQRSTRKGDGLFDEIRTRSTVESEGRPDGHFRCEWGVWIQLRRLLFTSGIQSMFTLLLAEFRSLPILPDPYDAPPGSFCLISLCHSRQTFSNKLFNYLYQLFSYSMNLVTRVSFDSSVITKILRCLEHA